MQKLVVTCASPPPVATVLRSSLATRTSAPSDSSTSTSHAGRSMHDSGRSRAILSMRSLLTPLMYLAACPGAGADLSAQSA